MCYNNRKLRENENIIRKDKNKPDKNSKILNKNSNSWV
jgi:hypothetical protein